MRWFFHCVRSDLLYPHSLFLSSSRSVIFMMPIPCKRVNVDFRKLYWPRYPTSWFPICVCKVSVRCVYPKRVRDVRTLLNSANHRTSGATRHHRHFRGPGKFMWFPAHLQLSKRIRIAFRFSCCQPDKALSQELHFEIFFHVITKICPIILLLSGV